MTLLRMCVVFCVLGLLGCKKPDPGAGKGKAEPASAAKAIDKAAETAAAPVAATAANRSAAKTLNVEGMKAHKAKNYPTAIEKFRAAIAADGSFALPHYNLACAAALSGDKATALAQLEWLAASSDQQARRTLIKGGIL